VTLPRSPLTRKTPLSPRPKSKGNRFERAIVDMLRANGWPHARRNFQSGGQGGSDIVDGPADAAIECKHQERLNIWACLAQCEAAARPTDLPILAFKRNGSQVYACVPLDELLALLKMRESA